MFRIDSLQRSRITYGCIVALGAVAAAGITEIEIHEKPITNWFTRVAQAVNDSMENGSSGGSPVTTQQVFSPFVTAGTEVSKVAVEVWGYIHPAFSFIGSLQKEQLLMVLNTIKDFLCSLFDSKIFNKIFENLHQKIWNIIKFTVAGGEGRNTFISLFGSSKRDSTLLAGKLLLGQTIPEIKNFKVNPNVFHYLFLRWMDKPLEVTGKFDRLSTYIKTLTDKLKGQEGGGSGGSGGDSQDDKYTYQLEIPTLKEYLDVESGLREQIFNTIWTGEVLLKIKTGTSDYVGAKTVARTFGGLLGSLLPIF